MKHLKLGSFCITANILGQLFVMAEFNDWTNPITLLVLFGGTAYFMARMML